MGGRLADPLPGPSSEKNPLLYASPLSSYGSVGGGGTRVRMARGRGEGGPALVEDPAARRARIVSTPATMSSHFSL